MTEEELRNRIKEMLAEMLVIYTTPIDVEISQEKINKNKERAIYLYNNVPFFNSLINKAEYQILTLIREAGYVKTKYSPKTIEKVMNRLKGIQEKDLEDYGPETAGDE